MAYHCWTPPGTQPIQLSDHAGPCPFCLKEFDDPHTSLLCGHNYCLKCIGKYYQSLKPDDKAKCPTCRVVIHMAPGKAQKAATAWATTRPLVRGRLTLDEMAKLFADSGLLSEEYQTGRSRFLDRLSPQLWQQCLQSAFTFMSGGPLMLHDVAITVDREVATRDTVIMATLLWYSSEWNTGTGTSTLESEVGAEYCKLVSNLTWTLMHLDVERPWTDTTLRQHLFSSLRFEPTDHLDPEQSDTWAETRWFQLNHKISQFVNTLVQYSVHGAVQSAVQSRIGQEMSKSLQQDPSGPAQDRRDWLSTVLILPASDGNSD